MVLDLLLPPDEQPPKAVHPGVYAFHDPAPRPGPWGWTHAAGRGRVGLIGVPQGESLGTGGFGKLGGGRIASNL